MLNIRVKMYLKPNRLFHPKGIISVELCLEFAPSLCYNYDITIVAFLLCSVVALRIQLSSGLGLDTQKSKEIIDIR